STCAPTVPPGFRNNGTCTGPLRGTLSSPRWTASRRCQHHCVSRCSAHRPVPDVPLDQSTTTTKRSGSICYFLRSFDRRGAQGGWSAAPVGLARSGDLRAGAVAGLGRGLGVVAPQLAGVLGELGRQDGCGRVRSGLDAPLLRQPPKLA